MRQQDQDILKTAGGFALAALAIDAVLQYNHLKKKGQKLTWKNYNGFQAVQKVAVFGAIGGIVGNEFYKLRFQEESLKPFSSDAFLKKVLANENVNSNPEKFKELKALTKEVKDKLYNEFSDQLVSYPETVGSLSKKIAITNTYDSDIIMPVKKDNHFGNMRNLSNQIHDKIEDLFEDNAVVIKRTRATSLLFQGNEGTHKIDIVYGREIGNYKEDKNLNLYIRRPFFWCKGKTFKTNIDIQKNLLVNRPKVREVVKVLKSYRDRNSLDLNNLLIEQLSLEALATNNFGRDFSLSENLKNTMEHIACKLSNKKILDYANSNHNLLNILDYSKKQIVLDSITNDLSRIKSNPHYIKEIFHC